LDGKNYNNEHNFTVVDACLIGLLTTEAVRKNKLTHAASDADVERVVRDWLRTASDRNGGRRQRESNRARPSTAAVTLTPNGCASDADND